MTRRDDFAPINPLTRANQLLAPVAVARVDNRPALMASMAFAVSGLTLAFIMLMGIGYDMDGERTLSARPAQMRPATAYGEVGTQAVEAVPLKDEEGVALRANP
jgi:hypothetical protein